MLASFHVNAMSTRIRRFGAAGGGESGSMLAVVDMENAWNQRLVLQVVEIPRISKSPRSCLITWRSQVQILSPQPKNP